MVFPSSLVKPTTDIHQCEGQREGEVPPQIVLAALRAVYHRKNSVLTLDFPCGTGVVTYKMRIKPLARGGCVIEGEAIRFRKDV